MSEFPPCNNKVFKNGTCIAIMCDLGSQDYEDMCKALTDGGMHTDWSFTGGRAVIRTLADPDKVKTALSVLIKMAEHPDKCILWQ